MEETISTTVEAPQEQTTLETSELPTTEELTQSEDVQEPEQVEAEATESVEGADAPKEPEKNWEQIAKDNQASFTRVSQELAELKKQVAAQKPQLVQNGKINPEFEQNYRREVDTREYLAYDQLARQLGPEQRAIVENLLTEAQRLYNPNNNSAYEQRMAQVKDYFRSDLVESIARDKMQQLSQMEEKFKSALAADKQERANKVAQTIEAVPELNELVAPESENFSQDVFDIVKTIFDYTGNLDVESTTKAVQKIKELGVKEYIAKQQAEQVKAKANVPVGSNVVQNQGDGLPTAEDLRNDAGLYLKTVKKLGGNDQLKQREIMGKLDAILMKG